MTGLCTRCGENEQANNDEWCPDCILEIELMLAELEEPAEPDFRTFGTNGTYTISDLEVRIAEYEDEYGLPSDTLLEMHRQEHTPLDLSANDRHLWLSMYRHLLKERT